MEKIIQNEEKKKRNGSLDLTSRLTSEPPSRSKERMQTLNENDSNCYICYTKPPNAINMNCGHGGMCLTCAQLHVKKKPECMECRGLVERIAYITKESGLKGVYRSEKYIKVTKTQDT